MEAMVEAASGAFQSHRLVFRPVENNERDKDFIHEAILSDPASRVMGNASSMFIPVTKEVSYAEIEAGIKDSLLSLLICLPMIDVARATNATTWNAGAVGAAGNSKSLPVDQSNLVPIGFLFLHRCGSGTTAHLRRTRISLQIAKRHQGFGYGTEAVRWALAWSFQWADLHRVEIAAASYNERAVGLYAKLGFTLEGRQREAVFMNGEWHDIVNFGMLQREWKAQVNQPQKA